MNSALKLLIIVEIVLGMLKALAIFYGHCKFNAQLIQSYLQGPGANHGVVQLRGVASTAHRKPIAGLRSMLSERSNNRLCCL